VYEQTEESKSLCRSRTSTNVPTLCTDAPQAHRAATTHTGDRQSYTKNSIFISYPPEFKGWLFYNPETKKTLVSNAAVFDERSFPGLLKSAWDSTPQDFLLLSLPSELPDQVGVLPVVICDGSVPVVISLDSAFLLPIHPSLWSVMVSYGLCPPSIFPYVLCPLPIAFL
jgi:hypothetical protein